MCRPGDGAHRAAVTHGGGCCQGRASSFREVGGSWSDLCGQPLGGGVLMHPEGDAHLQGSGKVAVGRRCPHEVDTWKWEQSCRGVFTVWYSPAWKLVSPTCWARPPQGRLNGAYTRLSHPFLPCPCVCGPRQCPPACPAPVGCPTPTACLLFSLDNSTNSADTASNKFVFGQNMSERVLVSGPAGTVPPGAPGKGHVSAAATSSSCEMRMCSVAGERPSSGLGGGAPAGSSGPCVGASCLSSLPASSALSQDRLPLKSGAMLLPGRSRLR